MARLIDSDEVIASVKSQVALCRLFSHADGLMHEDDLMVEIIDMLEKCFIQEIDNARTVYAIPVEWIEKWRDEKGRHMSERLVAGKIIVDWKWSLSEEDRKKYGID